MTEIGIEIGNTPIGKWIFEESAAALQSAAARRTADGFVMHFPSKLRLEWDGGLQPYVTDLRACIRLLSEDIEFGIACDHTLHQAARPCSEAIASLEWRGTFSALELLERRRNGRPPPFQFNCSGEAFYAKPVDGLMLRTIPTRFHGLVHVKYPLDAWVERIRALGHSANILVEVPIGGHSPAGWEPVFDCLEEARLAITRGGEGGWRGAIVAVRTALEKWREVEKPAFGPGWFDPPRPDLEKWTKEQRLDALRWWAHQFCNLAAHKEARHWKREDATVALSTLAALLSARDP